MSAAPRQDPPPAQLPGDCWQLVSPGKWTCLICRDNVIHPGCHLGRHISSDRHKESVEYVSYQWSLPQLTDDAGHNPALTQSPVDPSDAFINPEGLLNIFDIPTEPKQEPRALIALIESDGDSDDGLMDTFDIDPEDELPEPDNRDLTHVPSAASDEWYPWPNKVAATLDIISNTPRSVFSRRQLDTMLYFLRVNGVPNVPSGKTIWAQNNILHSMCGIRTLQYTGAHGHHFFVNSIADIISQEMANPLVRTHLHFYPEDAGKTVSEYWHGQHWHDNADPTIVTPMAVINGLHFFVHEPCFLANGCAIMPYCWFLRGGSILANAWPLRTVGQGDETGWVVEEYTTIVVPQDKFLIPFNTWDSSQFASGLPSARHIFGSVLQPDGGIVPWSRTRPSVGNRWRVHASGAPGLPRAQFQKEYNVHFLCTSNLASPLEMMDRIVEQLEAAWDEGIWAWDCVHEAHVLVIPFVAALLGDNPMQSEFAVPHWTRWEILLPHVRLSKVSMYNLVGHWLPVDLMTSNDGSHTTGDVPGTSDDGSSADGSPSVARGRKKADESMQDMVERITRFINIGVPRTRDDTLRELEAMAVEAGQVGNLTKIRTHRTTTGIKDTFLEVYLDRMYLSYKNRGTRGEKQLALDRFRATLPANILSPVWRIRGESS
ncbi:hypothetical protein H4582DRAFT_2078249 [Lactarius indigo]|nr:hypothetical protein H4582DRAFT_2078249 [Lactarius indigo]